MNMGKDSNNEFNIIMADDSKVVHYLVFLEIQNLRISKDTSKRNFGRNYLEECKECVYNIHEGI